MDERKWLLPSTRCVLLLSVFLLIAVPAAAQTLYGGVVGNVRDAQGAVVPGATVTIVNTGTNLTRDTVTDAQGAYNFVNVQSGDFMRIFGLNSAFAERQVRLALRYSF